jgi:type IX secretion system PorP/SprF family membrane protein
MNKINNSGLKIAILLLISFLGNEAIAQVIPHKSQFFENTALINPAYVGSKEEGSAALTYSSQLSKLDGSPKIMSAVVNTPLSKKTGVGITFVNDKAGLINSTSILGAYSYKVKFNEKSAIRFGIAAGILNDKLSSFDVNSPDKSADPAFNNYNDRHGSSWKVATGVLFTSERFEAQLAWHDLTKQLADRSNTVNAPGLTASVSYKVALIDSVNVKSLAGIRQKRGYNTYYDLGFNAEYLKLLNVTALYHTNKAFTGGVGLNYKDDIRFVFLYSTQSSEYGNVMGGSYEIVLSVPFRLKKIRSN